MQIAGTQEPKVSSLVEPITATGDASSTVAMAATTDFFYEGAEKLLEIWFAPSPKAQPFLRRLSETDLNGEVKKHPAGLDLGLRAIPREQLDELLALVKCTVLHASRYERMDSYVLSESSMFVAPYRIILKTCGRTSLLPAVPRILELAQQCGLTEVKEVFFSRRSFGRPELQPFPHQAFDDEVTYLNKLFDGRTLTLGCDDQWHLFTMSRHVPLKCPDQTFEVIMTQLDPAAMSIYYKVDDAITATDVTRISGIGSLFPGAMIDDFLFDPCGYSMNGIVDDHYFTIHITPQPGFSYVSFETDVTLPSYAGLMRKLLKIFRPGQFIATLMVNEDSCCPKEPECLSIPYQGYTLEQTCTQHFTSYTLNYASYVAKELFR